MTILYKIVRDWISDKVNSVHILNKMKIVRRLHTGNMKRASNFLLHILIIMPIVQSDDSFLNLIYSDSTKFRHLHRCPFKE